MVYKLIDLNSPVSKALRLKYQAYNSGPLTDMKLLEHSDAIVLAFKVLLHPGGP